MSKYEFKCDEVTSIMSTRNIYGVFVAMDMTTPQAKHAFLTLAGDTRLNELGEWMAELGYEIKEVETVNCDITDYTMRQGEMGNPDRSRS